MSTPSLEKLRRLNLGAGLLHLLSAIAVVSLANGFALPIGARYMAGQPGSNLYQQVLYGHISMALLIGIFFALSAIAHFVVATGRRSSYEKNLSLSRNPYRWLEYSLSASIMIVVIGQLTGISDVAALIALVGVNASMIGFGWMQERYEQPGGSLQPFWLGCLAGAVPWIALGIYLFSPGAHQHAPGFVYVIYFTIFVFFNCFALVQYLQYKKIGRFADYLVGERTYIVLSFVAKSLLAWQIFGSTLAATSH
jgi:Heliorhodopsin